MAVNEILQGTADDLKEIQERIKDAEELIKVLREAGQDTIKVESDLKQAKIQYERWRKTLENRGYTVEKLK